MRIESNIESGNIRLLDDSRYDDIKLEMVPDQNIDHFQWFNFQVIDGRGRDICLKIMNAWKAYANDWDGYQVAASYNGQNWFKLDTEYRDGVLQIPLTLHAEKLYLSYFAPFDLKQHQSLIDMCVGTGLAKLESLGKSHDGRNLDMVTIGDYQPDKVIIWILARQHPGETMAEWWVLGFLVRLLIHKDPNSIKLLREAHFRIVPNMNPDGTSRGHLRTNAVGADLN